MSSTLDSDAEELRKRADREKAKVTSSGRKASQAGLGILKKYRNLAEKTAKFRQQGPSDELATGAPLPVETSKARVEQSRGTFLENTTRGKTNHPWLEKPPVVETPILDSESATESSGHSNHQWSTLPPVVQETTGGNSNHGWSDLPAVVENTTRGTSIDRPQFSPVDGSSISDSDRVASAVHTDASVEAISGSPTSVDPVFGQEVQSDLLTPTASDKNQDYEAPTEPVVIITTGGKSDHRGSFLEFSEGTLEPVPDLDAALEALPVVKNTTGLERINETPVTDVSLQERTTVAVPPVVKHTTGGTLGVSAKRTSAGVVPQEPEHLGFDGLSFHSERFSELQKSPMKVLPQNGEFHIPHELFQAIVVNIKRVADRDVFCCLIRCSLGWHKDWCEAGLSYIAKWTHIQDKSNVAKALKRLIDKGLIEVLDEPNYKLNRGTTYRIPLATNYLQKKGKTPEPWTSSARQTNQWLNIPPVVQSTTGGMFNPGSDEPPTGGQTNYPRVVNGTTNKETPKEQKKELSLRSEKLNEYIANIPTKGQRETERAFLSSLLEDGINEPIIEKCLLDLNRSGVPPHGSQCLMPMKWLYTSGASMIRKHQAVSTPQPKVVPLEAIEESMNEDHPRWTEYVQWRKALSESGIVECLVGSTGQTEVQARHLVSVMEKEAGKKLMVEALLRADFLDRADTHKGQT